MSDEGTFVRFAVAAADFPNVCRIAKSSGSVRRLFQVFTIGTLVEEAEEDLDEDAISASLEALL
jgi:hypothetical protein